MVSLLVALTTLLGAGLVVGLLAGPPMRYLEFNSLFTGGLLSLVVGIAGALATADDVGRREMIGLAATAQVAIVPTWLGCCFIIGFPPEVSWPKLIWGLLVNVLAIVIASLTTYAAIGVKGSRLPH
jgi:Na+/proline symporter